MEQDSLGSDNKIGLVSAFARLIDAYELSSSSAEIVRECAMVTFDFIFQVRSVKALAVELTYVRWMD